MEPTYLFRRVWVSPIAGNVFMPFDLKGMIESPSFVGNPDAVDLSAEEGWSSEDTKRRGVAADRTTRALLRSGGDAASPPRDPGASIASIGRYWT